MIDTAIKQLRSIQRDFISIQEATKVFIEWAKSEFYSRNIDADIQEQFFEMRRRKKEKSTCKSCKNCARCCYAIIIKYNMFQGAYSALATAYQYLLTLPISQVECERSFSILKYTKNRLRNQLTDN
ncbi:hypothetical protein ALC62_05732 [Cyphomyrmex costatus]|uniref:HAT C-terminal dimerisation domain-containing protein n=1 Tax=Cyphomyrmex costatus TaxID=456900 RepID=A0A151IJI1_9HYME|nr:hypothetical protein ALC62_05732 [Cyphomyrmex costatus]